ncbi:hypothetical protein PSECIP111951_00112 [Pseudoalteromonas holothuriae]|uniref:DUF1294 domain-containing protein n=1 Tax=Pseudoalteromonas holothuriae TaxID=2963714 RepID=A0A9W4QTJ8_9GAMM|nr:MULTISPECIES: DUF1294 domain-containing protein [unclassified Pseudoalteromonas]CAH9050063.1 hypothetical protein PSECIP111951_00112 [Pseudoalteromonas sp. CIP111951]CAH9052624.1 hypothetical protein PSECIP111854_01007 [Pseudoalteromonas sp. CIP111854]
MAVSVNVIFLALSYTLSRCNWLLITLLIMWLACYFAAVFMAIVMVSIGYLFAMNVIFVWLFYLDKHRAIACARRVSETTLLCVSWLGANMSMFVTQKWLRHKNQKRRFNAKLCVLSALQTVVLVFISYLLVFK